MKSKDSYEEEQENRLEGDSAVDYLEASSFVNPV
jgi:hypothetical protein